MQPPLSRAATGGRVLVVDDEDAILRAFGRILRRAGYETVLACDATRALGVIATGGVDVVITDMHMPGGSGLGLLRAIRAGDPDLPVILMTGMPNVDSAAEAIEHRVWRYLTKPVDPDKLLAAVADGVRRGRARRTATPVGPGPVELDRALGGLWLAYQPIVSWSQRRIFAFEALVRSDEPGVSGGILVAAAEKLGRIVELGRLVRAAAAPTVAAGDALFFVNLHPAELLDETLYDPSGPLAGHAGRVVFEITERRSLGEIPGLSARLACLRGFGYRFALDDLGAGYAGLTSVAVLAPDIIKLDMSLVRGVNESPTKQKLVGSMTTLARDLAVPLVAEGVETKEERRVLLRLGCDLLQGFLFARPARLLPHVAFERLAAESLSAPPAA